MIVQCSECFGSGVAGSPCFTVEELDWCSFIPCRVCSGLGEVEVDELPIWGQGLIETDSSEKRTAVTNTKGIVVPC